MFLQIFQNSKKSTCTGVSFQIKLQASRFYQKRDSSPSASLEFCQNILRPPFLQNTSGRLLSKILNRNINLSRNSYLAKFCSFYKSFRENRKTVSITIKDRSSRSQMFNKIVIPKNISQNSLKKTCAGIFL